MVSPLIGLAVRAAVPLAAVLFSSKTSTRVSAGQRYRVVLVARPQLPPSSDWPAAIALAYPTASHVVVDQRPPTHTLVTFTYAPRRAQSLEPGWTVYRLGAHWLRLLRIEPVGLGGAA